MKYLIVNADDFGASPAINRGILEAHRRGILTSASLLITTPWSQQAAQWSRSAPRLSVGLHAHLGSYLKHSAPDLPLLRELPAREMALANGSRASCENPRSAAGRERRSAQLLWPDRNQALMLRTIIRAELRQQFNLFVEWMGHPPTHLDSHHNIHRHPMALPEFLDFSQEHGLPLREHSAVRYFPKFYGQWDGRTHLEQISVPSLGRMLELEIGKGITELACHPGYQDANHATGYAKEREAELRTLCDPRIRQALGKHSIRIVSYHDLARLIAA